MTEKQEREEEETVQCNNWLRAQLYDGGEHCTTVVGRQVRKEEVAIDVMAVQQSPLLFAQALSAETVPSQSDALQGPLRTLTLNRDKKDANAPKPKERQEAPLS